MENIYKKLVEVRKNATYIQKSTSGYKFRYADEKDILALIRPKLDEVGVWLSVETGEPTKSFDIVKQEKDKQGTVEKTVSMLEIPIHFTWVNADNPEERIKQTMYLQGEAGNPQALGGLLTYATRYFLYKNFMVATDEMDPDAFHNMTGKLTSEQVADLEREINGDDEMRKKILEWAGIGKISDLPVNKLSVVWSSIKKRKEQNNEHG